MSRTEEDWLAYKKQAIELREMIRDAQVLAETLQDDMRFTEQTYPLDVIERRLEAALDAANWLVGTVTGGWWDK